jgi:hypothetical protein
MVYSTYTSDGWGWAGGAGGVQGSASITNTGGTATAANEVFKFSLGSIVDSLNTTYGVGAWTVSNLTLSFASSYSTQNNSRFGLGSGTFDIYWVGNDNWAQSKGTTTSKALNPSYATSATDLATWAGSEALLASESFTVASGATGYTSLSYSLAGDTSLISDILTASATGSNQAVSLYLMGTSDTLGMIIFTGGQSQALPTLSFDVVTVPVPVPEPSSYALSLAGLVTLTLMRRKAKRQDA